MIEEDRKADEFRTLDMIDSAHVMEVCGDAARVEKLVAWMNELVDENVALMAALAEGGDEKRAVRLEHLASQISVYRRIKDAANRALDSDGGQPPPVGDTESAAEAPL